jgi:hypothetical protein
MPFPATSSGNPVRMAGALVLRWGLLCLLLGAACGDRDRDQTSPELGHQGPAASPDPAGSAGANGAAGAPDVEGAPPAAEVAELAALLARSGESGALADDDRQALERAMERLLQPGPGGCDDCRVSVTYVDEEGSGDRFRCSVLASDGDLLADLEVFHRPDLAPELAKAWARSTLAGHPASGLEGEHLFVWPGRLEIRAFGRGETAPGERQLEELLSSLPLDALAKL